MKCSLNGEVLTLSSNTNITDFLNAREINPQGKAVAINQSVIPKSKWDSTVIKENDNILLITATQGG